MEILMINILKLKHQDVKYDNNILKESWILNIFVKKLLITSFIFRWNK